MKKSRIAFWSLIGVTTLSGVVFVATSRAGYETAQYRVVKTDGNFEIREYKAHRVVSTPMKGGEQNGSFGRLFQYISGKNEARQKIEMTTPVFMPATEDGQAGEMQFVIPAGVAKAGAPAPADPSVKLGKMEGGTYAVLKYRGIAKAKDRVEKLAELRVKLAEFGLEAGGTPVHAGYDPPWTPGPMRRNEVLIRVK